MSLVWHIVRKDLRRMALPVAVWLALIVVAAVALRLVPAAVDVSGDWMEMLGLWSTTIMGIQLALTVLLPAVLLLEDALMGTTAWWMTRPVARQRLLAAKFIAASILFGAMPVGVLAVLWAAGGAGPTETIRCAGEFIALDAVGLLAGFAAASIARTLSKVLLIAVIAVVLWAAAVAFVAWMFPGPDLRFNLRSNPIVWEAIPVTVTWLSLSRFFFRGGRSWWLSLAVCLLVSVAIRAWQPVVERGDLPANKTMESITVTSVDETRNATWGPAVHYRGKAAPQANGVYRVPLALSCQCAWLATDRLAKSVALAAPDGLVEWCLAGTKTKETPGASSTSVRDAVMTDVAILGAADLRLGERYSKAGATVTIESIFPNEDGTCTVMLDERGVASRGTADARQDVYVAVDATARTAEVVPQRYTQSIDANGFYVKVTRLLFRRSDLVGLKLVQVRFAAGPSLLLSPRPDQLLE